MNTIEKIDQTQIFKSIDQLNTVLQNDPTQFQARSMLIEYLCVCNDFDRVEKQLKIIKKQSPDHAVSIDKLQYLLQAGQARIDTFNQGRCPSWINQASDVLQEQLAVLTHMRAKAFSQAKHNLEMLEQNHPALSVRINNKIAQGFRDLDDRTAYVFEALSLNGNYYWFDFASIASIWFEPIKQTLDLVWRNAKVCFKSGQEQYFFIPAVYLSNTQDENMLLGKETNWQNHPHNLASGEGQRTFLVGDESINILAIESLEFGIKP